MINIRYLAAGSFILSPISVNIGVFWIEMELVYGYLVLKISSTSAEEFFLPPNCLSMALQTIIT